MTDNISLKKCNLCKVATGFYKENEYTNLCLSCWSIIRANQGIEAINHPKFYIWSFEKEKLLN